MPHRLDFEPLGSVVQCPAEPVERRIDELLDVLHDALLELSAVLLTLFEQDPQGGVALVEDRRLAAQRALRAGELILHGALLA